MRRKKTAKVFKYTAIFEPDLKLGGYTVIIPALPGCISEGDSFEEALANIKEAAQLILEDLKKSEIPTENRPIIVSPIDVMV